MTIYTSPWPKVHLPDTQSVFEFVWSNPNKRPDSFVVLTDGLSGKTYTRGDLRHDCQRLAYGVRHNLGLQPESVVCVFSPNSLDYFLFVLGMQCGGYVVSGANAAYTATELAHQIEDSQTALVLCHPSILDVALEATSKLGWSKERQDKFIVLAVREGEGGKAGERFKTFDTLMSDKRLEPHKVKDPKKTVAFLGYSSGTSGKSKGVRTSHYNMTSVLSMLEPFDVGPEDTQMGVLPLNHIYGLTKVLHYPIHQGHKVVVMPRFELESFCSNVQEHKVTVCLLVPPIALLLAREPVVDKYDMSSLRLVISGAAPLGKELEAELSKRLGTNVAQAYGLTEASPTTHFCPLSNPKPGSIGPLLPMMRGRICDPDGNDLGPGKEGEMLLQGPNIMLGYLNRPDANAETLMTDNEGTWLKTGDVGYVDEEGYWYVTDRLKELIKYKGFQVAPAELEATLLECPDVADVAVIGVYSDDEATELPRAYVVLSASGKGKGDAAPKAIRDWVDGRVARHKKLRGGVLVIDVIPKSPSGKLLRRVLRDKAKADAAKASSTKAKL